MKPATMLAHGCTCATSESVTHLVDNGIALQTWLMSYGVIKHGLLETPQAIVRLFSHLYLNLHV
jgi:hypothetical protein